MARLSKIYTRTGDAGETGLADGRRIRKDSARIQAMGDIDELNSVIGILRTQQNIHPLIDDMLHRIQHRLFDIGGELSLPQHTFARQAWVDQLENWLDELNAVLPPLQEFILPGGNPAAAHCHHARTLCRRAERTCLGLDPGQHRSQNEQMNPLILKYLNRLSDLLFVMARTLARQNDGQEITWQKDL